MLVKGYKGMHSDMTCRGMQYEIGKTSHAEGTVELCRNGFRFCRKLTDVFDFYDRENENRFFEVEADEFESDGKKSVASSIRIIRELSSIQVNRAFKTFGNGFGFGYFGGNDGNGNGNGFGFGYGNGHVYGCGNGFGNRHGYGNGHGYGCGFRYGYSDSYVQGNGNGHGYGDGTQKIMIFE